MKKIFLIFVLLSVISPANADKLLKSGFINNKMDLIKEFKIDDPKNKIILIYNHGQDDHDEPSKNCFWKNGVRNMASLVGEKVNEKEIMVYIFCTNHLGGDDRKRLWKKKKFKPPYKGVSKLEKRLKEAGFKDVEIKRIFGPIGIKLGGRSAPEIALSIIAQLVSEAYKK